jgi:glutamate formiminotransferase/formiminotetrahydrofolate cyclodeaminase
MPLSDMTLPAFLDELASDSPAPGGGSVAALCGALSAALSAMTARLTLGKEKYRESWAAMEELIPRADALRTSLLARIDEDAASFDAYMTARRLPKATGEEAAVRKIAVERAAMVTASVPLSAVLDCAKLVDLAAEAVGKGNPNAVTDAGGAALLAQAAARAAAYNVLVNLPGVADQAFVAETRERVCSALETVDRKVLAIRAEVEERIGA